ncbi:MAG TPA: sugar ABC transporter ATP-binding protein [Vicinamibacterales bacterium]|nr:sugar ABC transporter ATP-binding protein [Vicinamibacterales bacterium]
MRGIEKRFDATVALAGVDLAVAPGEVCGLVGENGAGKSTLMAILSGALQPDVGEMRLGDRRYQPKDPMAARRAGVAMIYQELSLAPDLTVAHNISLGMEPSRFGVVDRAAMRASAVEALAELGRPDIAVDRRAGDLSVAEQQLVEIARAIAVGCRVLVLDEPTSTLGRRDVERLFALIRRLKQNGHAIVYISHFIEEVREVCDRIVVLRDGRVAGGGPAAMRAHDIVRMMVGRDVADLFPRTPRQTSEPVLQITGAAAGSATCTLHRGEILGIAGLVGAGRTELLRDLFTPPHRRWRQGIGMVSEDRKGEGVALNLDIADNLTLTRLEGMGPLALVLPARQHAAAARWVREFAIKCTSAAQPVVELSGGNQQKVALARLLHHDVDVLLLDEPTRGIDVASKAQIYKLIDALVAADQPGGRAPRAILLVSSYLPELLGLCDRIAVMRRGRLGHPRPSSEWTEHSLMLEATGAETAA